MTERIELNGNETLVSHYLGPSYTNTMYLEATDDCETKKWIGSLNDRKPYADNLVHLKLLNLVKHYIMKLITYTLIYL